MTNMTDGIDKLSEERTIVWELDTAASTWIDKVILKLGWITMLKDVELIYEVK